VAPSSSHHHHFGDFVVCSRSTSTCPVPMDSQAPLSKGGKKRYTVIVQQGWWKIILKWM